MVYPNKDIVEKYMHKKICALQFENDLLQSWIKEGKTDTKCVVCGAEIKNLSIQRMLRPYLWCCRECFQYKPGKIIDLEVEYNMGIVDILKKTTSRYGNIKSQCDALGICIPYFYDIIAKYCKEFGSHIEFMSEYTTGKRKETYKKKLINSKKPRSG